jgi:hypothetical protein
VDYPLENLGPERFQYFCQSLVVKEFPKVQCFPVGQPDGGRDAVSLYTQGRGDEFMVFQVKFTRNPFAEPDPHKWLVAIMGEELAKVRRLILQGASHYLLLTNIPGTAHPGVGSIDRLNKLMSETLGIPSQCWWRNDINRRLDDAWSLKWVYPDLMTGPDFLRWIAETGFSEHRERRAATTRAFLRTQYLMDEQVRFKQVELQNKLLDLFVDVPIAFREQIEHSKQIRNFYFRLQKSPGGFQPGAADPEETSNPGWSHMTWNAAAEKEFGAATLLLSEAAQNALPRIVVEGAPGQGKSTIAQYVCQVHRMRLLKETEVLSSVAEVHQQAPIRLPIKVDLRDFATWMGKKDPFNVEDPLSQPKNWHKSLESFLAALISNQSGGTDFTTDDLVALARISSILILFDGLDEVADIPRRKEVVEEIVRGVARIEENAASLQVIVTSRPAAFANSPGMPHGQYLYLQLLSLNRQLIMQYAERWIRARKLDSRESSEFRSVLREKLDQPHLRDLARNPMQLAILLSLLLTRGSSLPDKRTALYDFYMDLFFSREAEKSPLVRDHRELLVDIHRYLAWLLHSESELGNSRASISQERLQFVIREYLSREGHDPNLVNQLFTGMVERVVALVSRVEGTFEFEVQPLREYFAACHLYYTAPQSSAGKERPGSKPDRFDAIAANFYWLNVTRFYAGCYSKGELSSLVERLLELGEEKGFRSTSYPRILAATLLTDWVFAQNPKSVQQLVGFVLQGTGFRYLLDQTAPSRRRPGSANTIVLPPKCGREELIQRGVVILLNKPPRDFQNDVIEVLKAHKESPSDLSSIWIESYKASRNREDRKHWISCGVQLGVLSELPVSQLSELLSPSFSNTSIAEIMLDARRLDYIHSSEQLFEEGISIILDRTRPLVRSNKPESVLDLLSLALNFRRYAIAFGEKHPVPLGEILRNYHWPQTVGIDPHLTTGTESFRGHKLCLEFADVAELVCKDTARDWATTLEPWDRLVEAGRANWGNRWALSLLATTASGIRSSSEKCSDFSDLLDHSKSLCRRARYARLRSGAPSWWLRQLKSATDQEDILFVLLLGTMWATTLTLLSVVDRLDEVLKVLPNWQWAKLNSAVHLIQGHLKQSEEGRDTIKVAELPANLSERSLIILASNADRESRHDIYKRYFENSSTTDGPSLEFIQREALDLRRFGTESWKPDLRALQRCFESNQVGLNIHQSLRTEPMLPNDIAMKIMESPDRYAGLLVRLADETCRREVAKRVVPVNQVAERERWFE